MKQSPSSCRARCVNTPLSEHNSRFLSTTLYYPKRFLITASIIYKKGKLHIRNSSSVYRGQFYVSHNRCVIVVLGTRDVSFGHYLFTVVVVSGPCVTVYFNQFCLEQIKVIWVKYVSLSLSIIPMGVINMSYDCRRTTQLYCTS